MILRVFIVEDEEMIRKGLVHTINWAGMGCLVVGSAADGRSGLSSILQKRPDVVITDIRMPEMDGLEMLERALAVYSFRIILLTSYADFDYARRAISLRACDYLLKPLRPGQVAEVMALACAALHNRSAYIEIKEGWSMVRIPLRDIIYTDYYNHYFAVFLLNKPATNMVLLILLNSARFCIFLFTV